MPRISALTPTTMTPDQRRVYDDIAAGPRTAPQGGPLMVWLHSPGLADPAQRLGAHCRFDNSVERRLSELAILVCAAFWGAGYEWSAHAPTAAEFGISSTVIDAIRRRATPEFTREDEAVVYGLATELLREHEVADPTWARARALFTESQLVDLVGALGYYAMVSMTIRAFQVQPRQGEADPFA